MLKSQNRLKKDTDFSVVLKGGKRINGGDFIVVSLSNNLPETRVGVIVSKKVGGLAVKRNRIRRVVMAKLAELVKSGKVPAGKDIVIRFVKQPADLDNTSRLRDQIAQCLEKSSSA
jgi:ribonuclease P protein component